MAVLKALRGMQEILPESAEYWRRVESTCKVLAESYGYQEVRLPFLEPLGLYQRTVGENTDIVGKEMYAFPDRNGEMIALRPEGTAGCARMAIEKGLLFNKTQRFWYLGAMFRHERPQAGRYRQFHQFGVEAFGVRDPAIDAEIIAWSYRLFKQLGLLEAVHLELNTLALPETRRQYGKDLQTYFMAHKAQLSEAVLERLAVNPLRILDSKDPHLRSLIEGAPILLERLSASETRHFEAVQAYLRALEIPFRINPRLVRGLDYYTLTVFEWVTESLGAQSTLCAGGRYDALVSLLGARETPAIGCAVGLERVILLLNQKSPSEKSARSGVYLILLSEAAVKLGVIFAEKWRNQFSFPVTVDYSGASIRSQFKRAEASTAAWAVVIGADEVSKNTVLIKSLGATTEQAGYTLPQEAVETFFCEH